MRRVTPKLRAHLLRMTARAAAVNRGTPKPAHVRAAIAAGQRASWADRREAQR